MVPITRHDVNCKQIHEKPEEDFMGRTKLFGAAGVTTWNGKTQVSFANGLFDLKTLLKSGHSEIEMVELPTRMTKIEAVRYLKNHNFAEFSPRIVDALTEAEGQLLASLSDNKK